MNSWHEFITMGGYAEYVWPAFGIGFVVLVGHVVEPIVRRRSVLKRLALEQKLKGPTDTRE